MNRPKKKGMIPYRVTQKTHSLNKYKPVYTALPVRDETTDKDWFYKLMTQRARLKIK